ncbi:MAG: exodeoxyribonuclease V subunit gamma, partial [Proteobacteria bacterium]|nr:exodeoxyribonuclease V subunit gamma [Pseudomonadota bacterium]
MDNIPCGRRFPVRSAAGSFKIYTSNRLEILAEKLAQIVKSPVSGLSLSPLSQEIIIVQSKGMERWLSMELARQNGICANCRFPFPNAFLDDILKRFFPDTPGTAIFEPGVMTFSLLKILPAHLNKAGFESLQRYLTDDTSKLKLFQLSEKLADIFDQYIVFRPDMIFSWEDNGEDKAKPHMWQAQLWREIARGKENLHRAGLQKALINKIRTLSSGSDNLYGRISVFGISALPHFHMQAIGELSGIVEVNMFLLNPCREYWSDTLNDWNATRIKSKYAGATIDEKDLHIEKGNRLLSSMGEQGKIFFEHIISAEYELVEEYEEKKCLDLLSCLQSDILYLKDRKVSDNSDLIQPDSPDTSLQFHSCHSPMREVEVLYDNLLAMLEDDPELLPYDILVMTPDIEIYAPFVYAVFDDRGDNEPRIPFSVSDRSIRKESGVIDGFLSILDLKESRLKVSQVVSVLEYPGIKEKFGLNESDLEKIRGWIRDTRIRWGFDGADKTVLGLPGFSENTWKAGIERLLLGYAMPIKEGKMFSGILPFDGIEGTDAKVLGNFLEFMEKSLVCIESLMKKRTINGWHSVLTGVLDTFFAGYDDTQQEIQFIRHILGGMSAKAELSGYDEEIEIDAVKYYVKKALEHESSYSGFMSGGVTFCSMLPMRSIPFKVICLLGMNNDAFPRSSYLYGFDLMAGDPRPGDRSKKKDDKYLFLEALISARKIFYISYVGQSIQDNTPIPPSVLVSELLDYVREGFGFNSGQMINSHKLQAFSPEYFRDKGKLFSYSAENMLAACSLYESRRKGEDNIPLISKGLCEPPDEFKILNIESLCNFFTNPAKYLLQKRLGIYLQEKESILSDKENFDLTGLDNYLVNRDLVADMLAGKSPDYSLRTYRAEGRLPHGNIGEILFKESTIDTETFVRKIEEYKRDNLQSLFEIDMTIDDYSLTGRLTNIYESGMLNFRYAAMKAKNILRAWIYHLVLCSHRDAGLTSNTILVCMDKTAVFAPVGKKSREYLIVLLNLYWEGLSKPLLFFPYSSEEYVRQAYIKKKNEKYSMQAARNKWLGNKFSRGESKDPYYDICFRNSDINEIFNDLFAKNS